MQNLFKLHSPYKPTGDQPEAIKTIVESIRSGNDFQTLHGVTGSGKTFTMASIIQELQRPALIMSLLRVADPLAKLEELYAARDPLYREAAHFVVEGTHLVASGIVQQLMREFGRLCKT